MSNPKFEIKKATNGEFYFVLKAVNGQVVLTGETYTTKAACHGGIASVKENAPYDSRYERKDSPGNYRFNLRASNGKVIGVSESYTTVDAREKGIASVKGNAPDAETYDLT